MGFMEKTIEFLNFSISECFSDEATLGAYLAC